MQVLALQLVGGEGDLCDFLVSGTGTLDFRLQFRHAA